MTAAKARELLSDVLEGRKTDYDRVILSDYAWTVEAAEIAAQAIMMLPRLTDVQLGDIIASKPEAEGLAGLSYAFVYSELTIRWKDADLFHLQS